MTKIISPVQYLKIICVYKSYSLEITKEEDSEYFKCELIGNVFSKPRKITNESLEIVLAFFKSHVDNFNIGISSRFMELKIIYKDHVLDVEYDPNINKVVDKEDTTLNKLVSNFQQNLDKPQSAKKLDNSGHDLNWVYEEREINCEQDVWHNIEVRNNRHQRDLKRLKAIQNNQENSKLSNGYNYKGYKLSGNTIYNEQGKFLQINAECKEINFTLVVKELDYDKIINTFKNEVDKYIEYQCLNKNLELLDFERRYYNYSDSTVEKELTKIYCWYTNTLDISLDDVKKKYFELNNK